MRTPIVLGLMLLVACGTFSRKPFLSIDEYAVTAVMGRVIVCSEVVDIKSCGVSLNNCTTGAHYECTTDVEIIDLRSLAKRTENERYKNAF